MKGAGNWFEHKRGIDVIVYGVSIRSCLGILVERDMMIVRMEIVCFVFCFGHVFFSGVYVVVVVYFCAPSFADIIPTQRNIEALSGCAGGFELLPGPLKLGGTGTVSQNSV